MEKHEFKKSDRYNVWKKWSEGAMPIDIADELNLPYSYVSNLCNRWKSCDRMDKIRSGKIRLNIKYVEVKETTLEKLSKMKSFSNPFVLITTNWRVQNAYHNMVTNRNTDIPL